jgi:hypothetical protein
MIEPTCAGLSKLGTALNYLTHGNVEVLAELLVSADVFQDEKFHDGRQIRDARDTRDIMRSGQIDPARLQIVEKKLLPRIRYAGYESLEAMKAGMDAAGKVVARTPLDPPEPPRARKKPARSRTGRKRR